MKLSIAIITRNRGGLLKECLQSLTKQITSPFEIIIVDNASKDKTREVVNYFKDSLRLRYFYEESIGIPYARNRALKEAKGDVIAFIDDDCIATKTWVREIIKAHQKLPFALGIQGNTLIHQKGQLQKVAFFNYSNWIAKNLIKNNQILVCDTKNVSFKLERIKKIGINFDTNFFRGSDVDFAKQILFKGEKIYFVPSIKAFHSERKTIKEAIIQRYHQGQTTSMYRMKWPIFLFKRWSIESVYERKIDKEIRQAKKNLLFSIYNYLFHVIHTIGKNSISQKDIPRIIQQREKKIKDISVAIVTRNRASDLFECLKSLTQQTVKPLEVIVVDNMSKDKTKQIVLQFKNELPIRYLYEKKIGISYARNTALRDARGKIIVFIDDDCIASSTWIEEMVYAHEYFPKAVAIQGYSEVYKRNSIISYVTDVRLREWIANRINEKGEISTVITQNASFKTTILKKLDLEFDTNLFRYRGEDTDIALQLLLKKQQIYYWSQAIIYYQPRKTFSSFLFRFFDIGRSNARMSKKWPNFYADYQNVIRFEFKDYVPFYHKYKLGLIYFFNFLVNEAQKFGYTCELIILDYIDIVGLNTYTKQKKCTEEILNLVIRLNDKKVSKTFFYKYFLYAITPFVVKKLMRNKNLYSDVFRSNNLFAFAKEIKKQQLKTPAVSIGIITKNRVTYLYYCLLSLLSQKVIHPKQIIVVDNGSTDETKELIMSLQRNFKFLKYYSLSNSNIPELRNKILEEAKSKDIVGFIDDDVTVYNTWLLETITAHEKYPDAVAIQGQSINMPQSNIYGQLLGFFKYNWMKQNTHLSHMQYRNVVRRPSRKGYVFNTIDTRNCSFKINKLQKLGMSFDTTFFRDEDTDFGKRLIEKKEKILFYPKILVYHWDRDSFLSFIHKNFIQGRSRAKLEEKWFFGEVHFKNTFSTLWNFLRIQPVRTFSMMVHYMLIFHIYNYVFTLGYKFEKYKNKYLNSLAKLRVSFTLR